MWPVFAKRHWIGSPAVPVAILSLALMMGVLWFLGNPEQVYACKCAQPGTPSEELEKFSAVFSGRVVSVQHSYEPNVTSVSPEDRTTVGFEVNAVWRGLVREEIDITTPPTGGSCGFNFTEGEEYIVYAYDSTYAGGGYTVGICSRTALLDQAQADIDALGEGNAPQDESDRPAPEAPQGTFVGREWAVILVVAAAVLAAGGIVVFAIVRHR